MILDEADRMFDMGFEPQVRVGIHKIFSVEIATSNQGDARARQLPTWPTDRHVLRNFPQGDGGTCEVKICLSKFFELSLNCPSQADSHKTCWSSSWRKERGEFLSLNLTMCCSFHITFSFHVILTEHQSKVSNEIEQHVWVVEEDGKFLKLLEVNFLPAFNNMIFPKRISYLRNFLEGGWKLHPSRLRPCVCRQTGARRRTA